MGRKGEGVSVFIERMVGFRSGVVVDVDYGPGVGAPVRENGSYVGGKVGSRARAYLGGRVDDAGLEVDDEEDWRRVGSHCGCSFVFLWTLDF